MSTMGTKRDGQFLDDVVVENDSDFNENFKVDEKKTPTFDFTEKTWTDDYILIVENTRLHVAKSILAHASPVFNKMLQGDFKEKNSTELELPGKKVEDVQTFLRCIYPDRADVNLETVNAVLPLAEEYQVANLKAKCKRVLFQKVNETISPDDVYNVLEQAMLYSMPDLVEECVEVASTMSFDAYQKGNKKLKNSPEVKCMILERMMSRLKPKTLLEVMKGYSTVDLTLNHRFDKKYHKQWDGCCLNAKAALNTWTPFEVNLHGVKFRCNIYIASDSYYDNRPSSFTIESDARLNQKITIQLLLKFVLQPTSTENEPLTRKREFQYIEGTKEEFDINELQCGRDFNRRNFLYHDRLNIEVYILAKKF